MGNVVRSYYVSSMTNVAGRASTLAVGVTNTRERRGWEHRTGQGSVFGRDHRRYRLVWCEEFSHIGDAIGAAMRIKGWMRARKIALIEAENPNWQDLAAGWCK